MAAIHMLGAKRIPVLGFSWAEGVKDVGKGMQGAATLLHEGSPQQTQADAAALAAQAAAEQAQIDANKRNTTIMEVVGAVAVAAVIGVGVALGRKR